MSKGPKLPREIVLVAANRVCAALSPLAVRYQIAGSLRRELSECGDADIVAVPKGRIAECDRAIAAVCHDGKLDAGGGSASFGSVRVGDSLVPINVFYTTEKSFGAALMYATGSKRFNLRYRKLARNDGLKVNQYGVFRGLRMLPRSGQTEGDLCRAIGIRWVFPRYRTDDAMIARTKDYKIGRARGSSQ